jgi:hypothetical protein
LTDSATFAYLPETDFQFPDRAATPQPVPPLPKEPTMKTLLSTACLMLTLTVLVPGISRAADIDELERRIDIVTQELQSLKNESAVADQSDYSSSFGLGPAASKVYKLNKGLSIGGYGEGHFTNLVSDKGDSSDTADLVRLILYAGYKFSDKIVFNSEMEFEHAKAGEGQNGEVSVELATLDFLLSDAANARVGMMLVPVGLTNELHEPTLYHGNDRPQVERDVIPSTWREMGVGLFGNLAEGLDYKLYLINGLNAAKFKNTGIRGGRQNGSKAKADDWAVVARLDYEPVLGLKLGGSTYLGDSGQGQTFAGETPDVFTEIYEVHGQYKAKGLELKGLYSMIKIDDADLLSEAKGVDIAEEVTGWYGELAYDIMPLVARGTTQYMAPFFRYEEVEFDQAQGPSVTAGASQDYSVYTVGLSYKPIPNVVLKADYRNFDKEVGTKADELNFGFGYIF